MTTITECWPNYIATYKTRQIQIQPTEVNYAINYDVALHRKRRRENIINAIIIMLVTLIIICWVLSI